MATGNKPELRHAPNPQQLRVLVVAAQQTSRAATLSLLRETGYQATGAQAGSDALQLLRNNLSDVGEPGWDIILKEHEPPNSNAANFLRKLQSDATLKTVPVVVFSSYDNREVVLKCLSLGASDYWIKPLRVNEVRNLWTRVWWRKAAADGVPGARLLDASSDEASEYTKNGDEQEPTSKEGSAPDGDAQHLTAGGAGHASGNGSSGIAGAQLLNAPDGSGNGNGSSGNGEKGHVGSNTGMGSGDATGNGSNGGHGNGSGQLGSGNGASAVANGNTSNDGNGTNNHVGSNFGNGNGSNGNGNGNHVGSNFGNGNGSNGNGLTTNGLMPYDASTTAKPAGPHHHHAHHQHLHGHPHHAHMHGRHHHGMQAVGAGQGADAAASAAAAAAQQAQQPGLFQSPPPRPRMAGTPPDVRPMFASTFGVVASTFGLAERNPSGTTNGNGGSSGNGGTSSPPAAALDTAEGAQPDRQVPRGFAAWADLHHGDDQDQGQGPLPIEVAEVAEALTSLRESGGSPGGSQAQGAGGGGGRERAERDWERRKAPAPGAQPRASPVVKPVPLKFSRTTISDDTRLPHSRGGAAAAAAAAAAANPRGPGGSAPPTLVTFSDPGRGPHPLMGAATAGTAAAAGPGPVSAHFPRVPAQMLPPMMAMQQHAAQHSMSGSMGGSPLLTPQQSPLPHGSLFGPFPPPPYGPLPPFMPPPIGFPWAGPGMTGQPPLDPAQLHQGLGAAGAPPFQFPFGGPPGPFLPQTSQEMAAMQQAMMTQQGYQQGYMLPYQQGLPPHAYPHPPWVRPPGQHMGPWGHQPGPGPAQQAAQPTIPPAMLAPTAAGGLATTQLVMPSQSLARSRALAGAAAAPGAATSGPASVGAGAAGAPLAAAASGADGTKSVVATEALSKREARLQALNKYKEKRKNLNASNKIRYQARKALAEARPRVKGQFVKVAKDAAAAEQGSNGGALTTAASPHVTCDGGAGPSAAQQEAQRAEGEVVQPMEQDGYEDEGLEYDRQEEDLGEEEEEEGAGRSRAGAGSRSRGGSGLQRMAIDAPAGHGSTRCRLQADESESATQSITDPHQGLHMHAHPPSTAGAGAAAPSGAAAAAGGALPMDAGGPLPSHASHHYKPAGHITGQKHKRDSARAAAARNGSDSGSNSPGDQTPSGLGGTPLSQPPQQLQQQQQPQG